jgi:cytochrome d ubiquinol oxidase subunit I
MGIVDISRWQFGITTVYHFVFVPLTIGLAPLIALMQTIWMVTGNNAWYRLTKFFGKLFLINFAIGVATGLVQEFQFGMNWSEYSRFVGDVFGAPLAMEGLAAFFSSRFSSACGFSAGGGCRGLCTWPAYGWWLSR